MSEFIHNGWGDRAGKKPGSNDNGIVRCEERVGKRICGKRETVAIREVVRSNIWPECHGQTMRLLDEDEAEQHFRTSRASRAEAEAT